MKNSALIASGKLASKILPALKLGSGSTWPGHIALHANKNFIKEILSHSTFKIILVAGTNGKTTTARMIRQILEADGKKVIHNEAGANLLNGIASALLLACTPSGRIEADYGIFEIDENALPQILSEMTPDYILLLNLFRDQLDRYGEVETIVQKWRMSLERLPEQTTVIANADDPRIAHLAMSLPTNVLYFGLESPDKKAHTQNDAVDSIHCPRCGTKLTYISMSFSHLGDWVCPQCGLSRPNLSISNYDKYPLSGTYNIYNTITAVLISRDLGTDEVSIANALKQFVPVFGRQELIKIGKKQVQIFLSKNPTGFNESLRTVSEMKAKHVCFILNDRVADGHDVSWIWDIDMETYLPSFEHITVTGDRWFDLGLRMKYGSDSFRTVNPALTIEPQLGVALEHAMQEVTEGETLFILPTYTAMLEVRKILTGRKIL